MTRPRTTFEGDLRAAVDASTLLDLPASAVQALLTGAVEIQLPPAAILYRDADRPRAGVVVRGLVRVYMTSPEGRHITVRYARPGDILGIAVGVGGPAAVSVATVVETALAMFDLRTLEALARSDPRVGWWAAEEVTRRLYETLDELAGTVFLSVRQRVARHLLDLATERRTGEALVAAIGQQDLADAVGSGKSSRGRSPRSVTQGSSRPAATRSSSSTRSAWRTRRGPVASVTEVTRAPIEIMEVRRRPTDPAIDAGNSPARSEGQFMDHHASAERLPLVLVPCFSGAPWETKDFPEWRDRPLVTGQLPDAPSLESYADVVEAWAGGLDEYVLVGDSFGASVALALAARRPSGLRALVLSGGFAKANVSTLTRARAGAARLLAGPGYPITVFFHVQSLGSRFDPPGTAAALRSIFLHHADAPTFSHRAAIVLATDLRPSLDRIAVPTLVLTPEDDRLIGPAAARELTTGIPGATELVLPGTGHLFRFTHVHEYATAVERFLSGRIGESAAA